MRLPAAPAEVMYVLVVSVMDVPMGRAWSSKCQHEQHHVSNAVAIADENATRHAHRPAALR